MVNLLKDGFFNQYEPNRFDNVINAFMSPHDPWMTIADFASFVKAQEQAALAYQDKMHWNTMSILNTAHSGKFSTDRTMQEYNKDIWQLEAIAPKQD